MRRISAICTQKRGGNNRLICYRRGEETWESFSWKMFQKHFRQMVVS